MEKQIANTKNTNIEVLGEFTRNLEKAVSATGLTPYLLAKKLGLDKAAVKTLLQGDRDPRFSTVVKLVIGMHLSLDQLLGNTTSTTPSSSSPVETATAKIVVTNEKADLISSITKMHESDVELLVAIAGVLEARRSRAVAKLLQAVRKSRSPKKVGKNTKIHNTSDEFDEDDFTEDEDDDFDEYDDFGEDDEFEDSDDFDEDDEDFDDDFDNDL